MDIRHPKTWPRFALFLLFVQVFVPGYILYSKVSDDVKSLFKEKSGGQSGNTINNNGPTYNAPTGTPLPEKKSENAAPTNNCNVTGGTNNGTITTCPTINPPAPRDPNGLYQFGQKIGSFSDAEEREPEGVIVLNGFHLDGANVSNNLEFKDFIIQCPIQKMVPNMGNTPMHIATTGPQRCLIVGKK